MCGGHGMEKLYVEYSPEDICLVKCKGSDFLTDELWDVDLWLSS